MVLVQIVAKSIRKAALLSRTMGERRLPTVFISHGAPTLMLEDIPARKFLKELGAKYRRVRAVVCISAHWETPEPAVNAVGTPDTVHDFYGFPEELYNIDYPAQGEPRLAEDTADLIRKAGLKCDINRERGLDHGAWVPLMLMSPKADVPVLQLSIQHHLDPAKHLAVSKTLSGLRDEGILILGSGGAVHPLGYSDFYEGKVTDPWAIAFDDWLTDAVIRGDQDLLVNFRRLSPHPERAHPRPDHFMPILSALGAAGDGARGTALHRSWQYGNFEMGAYSFE